MKPVATPESRAEGRSAMSKHRERMESILRAVGHMQTVAVSTEDLRALLAELDARHDNEHAMAAERVKELERAVVDLAAAVKNGRFDYCGVSLRTGAAITMAVAHLEGAERLRSGK